MKVQRPSARARIEADLSLLYELARLLEAVVEETGVTTPTGVVEEFDRTIHEELDFAHEARNAQLMADAAARRGTVVIPKVHAALSCATVLTLDFVEGVKISDVTAATGTTWSRSRATSSRPRSASSSRTASSTATRIPGTSWSCPATASPCSTSGWWAGSRRAQQEVLVTLLVAVALRDAGDAWPGS